MAIYYSTSRPRKNDTICFISQASLFAIATLKLVILSSWDIAELISKKISIEKFFDPHHIGSDKILVVFSGKKISWGTTEKMNQYVCILAFDIDQGSISDVLNTILHFNMPSRPFIRTPIKKGRRGDLGVGQT